VKLEPNQLYHVYNRGNNRQRIFFEKDNYYYFLRKLKSYLVPNCDLIAYCLMPNHFHLLIHANEKTIMPHKRSRQPLSSRKNRAPKRLTLFEWGLQQLLSSYSKGINKKYNRTGSLFQQNTKSKRTSSEFFNDDYSAWCFLYIHNNPKSAGLVVTPEDYEFTSYLDYLGLRSGSLCNISLGKDLLNLELNELVESNSIAIPPHIMKEIFR
jgi:REP element-mobilizing transposase RayT